MSYAGFGLKIKDPLESIKALSDRYNAMVKKDPTKVLDGYSLELLLRENYDLDYKLVNHNLSKDPLALVTMNPKEDCITHGDMFNRLRRFRIYKVHEHTGLSQTEFFNQPRHIVEMTFRELGEEMERTARITNPNLYRQQEQKIDVVSGIDAATLSAWKKSQAPNQGKK